MRSYLLITFSFLVVGLFVWDQFFRIDDYRGLLKLYPATEREDVVREDFFERGIPYPSDTLFEDVFDKLSESEQALYQDAFTNCEQEIVSALSAFPGYEYQTVTIADVNTYKKRGSSPTSPFLFIQLYGDLYQDDEHPRDQYNIIIRTSECRINAYFKLIPDEEQANIVGYLLRLSDVERELRGEQIDEVTIQSVFFNNEGKEPIVSVNFKTTTETNELKGDYEWYGLDVSLNLQSGELHVDSYEQHSQEIFIPD